MSDKMIMSVEKTCAFTGHRELSEKVDIEFLDRIIIELIEEGYDRFLCGMARGFDLIAAREILKLKEKYTEIKLIAYVPCPGQEKYYPPEEKKKYGEVINKCNEIKTVSSYYFKGCMQLRDRLLVDDSSAIIAYRRQNAGGTHYTLTYAAKNDKRIFMI